MSLAPRADGREDRSRHRHWRKYCTLAAAVGRAGDDVAAVQRRFEAANGQEAFLRAMRAEEGSADETERLARRVLGIG